MRAPAFILATTEVYPLGSEGSATHSSSLILGSSLKTIVNLQSMFGSEMGVLSSKIAFFVATDFHVLANAFKHSIFATIQNQRCFKDGRVSEKTRKRVSQKSLKSAKWHATYAPFTRKMSPGCSASAFSSQSEACIDPLASATRY